MGAKYDGGGRLRHEIDGTDRHIIALLQADGRQSNVEMARRLGLSEGAVRKRADRLLASGVVRVVALPDLEQVGLETKVIITMRVEPDKVDDVGNGLREMEEVRWVGYTTGEYDLICEAVFPSDEHLLQFLTHRLAALPGIRSTTTSHVLRALKDAHEWRIPAASPRRVLVVDDDPDFVEFARMILESEGYEVGSASDGSEALAAMQKDLPALVVLDVMMAGILDGLDASKQMRLDKVLRRIPILMVSSITGSEYAGMFPTDEYIAVDNFLSKPVAPKKFLSEVKRLLRR
jgi:Lrp/AsnC family transcriptional regulator for asnA, asnC and gidA